VDGGGRKKSDLYKSIVRLGQVVVALEDGIKWEPQVVSVKVWLLGHMVVRRLTKSRTHFRSALRRTILDRWRTTKLLSRTLLCSIRYTCLLGGHAARCLTMDAAQCGLLMRSTHKDPEDGTVPPWVALPADDKVAPSLDQLQLDRKRWCRFLAKLVLV
jgi:hypothetical protein